MGKEIKNKFNESINKIKDNINNIDEKDIKKENIEILEIDEIVTYIKKNLKIMEKETEKETEKEKETSSTYGLRLIFTSFSSHFVDQQIKMIVQAHHFSASYLIGTKIALLDLKSEIEQKEHIKNYLKK